MIMMEMGVDGGGVDGVGGEGDRRKLDCCEIDLQGFQGGKKNGHRFRFDPSLHSAAVRVR